MATILKADGTSAVITPANGKKFTLKELQTHVGGYIERVPGVGAKDQTMLVDEDGISKGLPFNAKATNLTNGLHIIRGNALLVIKKEWA